ncbi:hypothetical protein F442_20862, partial [Phytophthora nicotianae P10297]
MTHHLVVYVFHLTGRRSQSGKFEAAVLARLESPGFSLMSYRRSGNNGQDAGCDLPAINQASRSTFSAVEVDVSVFISASDAMRVDTVGRLTPPINPDLESKVDAPAYLSGYISTGNSTQSAADQSDAAFWACDARVHLSGLAEKAKHLLILWRFLGYVTLADAGITLDALKTQLRCHWLRAAAVLRPSPSSRSSDRSSQLEGVISSLLLSLCRGTQAFRVQQTATREQDVVQATAHLLLRALSSRAVQHSIQSAFSLQTSGVNNQHVRERFIVLLSDIYEILSDLCRLSSPDVASVFPRGHISLPALVDEVVSLIYTQRQFTGLRSEISALLRAQLGPIGHLFGCFTAQIQEIIFAAQIGPDPRVQNTGGGDEPWRAWNRRWLLEPGSIQVISIPQGHKVYVEPSLVEFSRWVYEFACIDLTVDESGSRLSVCSVFPMVNGTAPTEFLLDGRLRTFRSTPSGISSILLTPEGWSIGDYAARMSGHTNTINFDFYALTDSDLDTGFADQGRRTGQRETSTTVCWVSVTFAVEGNLQAGNLPDVRDHFIFF